MRYRRLRCGACASALAGALLLASGAAPTVLPLRAHAQDRGATAGIATVAPGGTVRALVVGINQYRAVRPLEGAVADAQDLAATLGKAGVRDVTVLIDAEVSRATLLAAMDGVARRAGAGDLIIVTFAGHGAQEKGVVSAAEPDGWDEYFLLPGFATKGDGTAERILDDEMFAWLGRVAASGAHIIFLADVCYAGGLTKSVDPRVGKLNVRGLKRVDVPELAGAGSYYIDPKDDKLPPRPPAPGKDDDATRHYPSLTFIAAVDDRHEAPELMIGGSPRGAASYAFARALEGQADADKDGVTTRLELIAFVRQRVLELSFSRQAPVGAPITAGSGEVRLFRVVAAGTKAAPDAAPAPSAVSKAPAPKLTVLEGAPVRPSAETQVLWDRRTGDLLNAAGDVLAYAVPEWALPAALERAGAYRQLVDLGVGRLAMSIAPADRVFAAGSPFTARIEGLAGLHLVLMSLAGDGTVHYLLPRPGEDNLMLKDSHAVSLASAPPFGTDALVAIATKGRRRGLELDLRLLDSKRQPKALVKILQRHLTAADRMGIAVYSTRPK
jgi:hypothetical protein